MNNVLMLLLMYNISFYIVYLNFADIISDESSQGASSTEYIGISMYIYFYFIPLKPIIL